MFKQYLNTSYDIYDDGRCYSHKTNKFLTPKMSVKYPTYNLTIEGCKKSIKIHRMVAETFLPHDSEQNIVNHKDGDTHNFHVNNLEWVDSQENSRHAHDMGIAGPGNQTPILYTENLPEEEWVPIKDYPLYMVSSCGRVINIKTKRLIKSYADNSGGYQCISLWKDGQSKRARIHKLVYSNFNQDYDLDGYVINHKDGNKNNNYKDNLEKITYQENNYHAVYVIQTNKCNKPVIQITKNGEEINSFNSIAEAQRITNIKNISRAISKKGRAGGYYWRFK